MLIEFNQTKCFYCGRELRNASGSSSPVDHFIPWNFVKDDKLWNFVLACPHCNSLKSNILPDRQYFEEMWHLMVLKVAGGCRKTRIVKILAQKSKYFGIYFAQVADNSKTYNYKFYS